MNTFFEAVDDYLINWYFANEKDFEKPFQNSLRKSRLAIIENPNDSGYIKAYNVIEDTFYIFDIDKEELQNEFLNRRVVELGSC